MNDPKAFYDKYKSLVCNLALNYSTNKEDAGKKTSEKYNIPLFYIYKNGDVDRNLIVK